MEPFQAGLLDPVSTDLAALPRVRGRHGIEGLVGCAIKLRQAGRQITGLFSIGLGCIATPRAA